MRLAMLQDKIVRYDQVDKCHFDLGTFFGDGVYEVIRSYNGKLFAFEEHLERFEHSLSAVDISEISIETIRRRVIQAFEAAEIANAHIYFHVTRGSSDRNLVCNGLEPNFFLTIKELEDDSQLKADGVKVSIHPDWRWKRCHIKSLNLLPNVLARRDAAKKGCWEAILVDEQGFLTEGSGSAFFIIENGVLKATPKEENILPSITRKFVTQAAEAAGINFEQEHIKPEQARKADEIFLAVTTKDIIPVVEFDGTVIGSGQPGRITKELIAEFRKFIS